MSFTSSSQIHYSLKVGLCKLRCPAPPIFPLEITLSGPFHQFGRGSQEQNEEAHVQLPPHLWGGQHSPLHRGPRPLHRGPHRDSKTQIPSYHCRNLQLQASPLHSGPPKGTEIQNCNLQNPAQLQFNSKALHYFLEKFSRGLGVCFWVWAQPRQQGSCACLGSGVPPCNGLTGACKLARYFR